ncbi:hypothetical protein GZH53_16840 [Flavihumibacter sp. R14]|nr:hypothetical protein [Flavihumibacter soli]
MSGGLRWYVNRFKTLTVRDLIFRIWQICKHIILKRNIGRKFTPGFFKTHAARLLYTENLEDVLGDPAIRIFGITLKPTEIRDWSVDVSSGKKFPDDYSPSINMRNSQYGSAKHVWELNRMLFLPKLALQYQKYRQQETLDLIVALLSSWIDQNLYLKGINWYSNIEVNIRLINWVLTWDILNIDELKYGNEDLNNFVEKKWGPSIYAHCKFSFDNPSLHSSANNHLISEYAGLFIANCKWTFPESVKWLKYSKNGLEKQIVLQHSENGINREETAKYIQFITDFFLICIVFGEKVNIPFSSVFNNRFYKILGYIDDLLNVDGKVLNYGDEDDGRVFNLDSHSEVNTFYSLLTSGAIYFRDSFFRKANVTVDLKNLLLFGSNGEGIFQSLNTNSELKTSKAYSEEGHFIFRLQEDAKKEILFHFDAAPLGYLAIAAHGHSDALSFILHVDGSPYLVDPGTYCYHTHPEWRQYFLSTKAHNTITVNNESQATYVGPTLWLNHYDVRIKDFGVSDKYDYVIAEHNGYKNYNVYHQRKVEFFRHKKQFIITDQIFNNSNRTLQIKMPFHIHPKIEYQLFRDTLLLSSNAKNTVQLKLDGQLTWNIHKGETSPILGWYSESFYSKTPSPVCLGSVQTGSSLKLNTVINIY